MEYTRRDLILLDDDLEIMVVPHKAVSLPSDRKWLTYNEVDDMRLIFPRFPRMLQTYNEMCIYVESIERSQGDHSSDRANEKGEQGEESD